MYKLVIFLSTIIVFHFLGLNHYLAAQVTESDSLVLVALYDSTDGDNWLIKTNWLSGPVSEWYGISVFEGRVTWIDLGSNNLTGRIPPEIGNLTELLALFLYDNNLSGTIPPEIGNLVYLNYLNLSQNQLTGSIPEQITLFPNLGRLNLSYNQMDGSIPASLGDLPSLFQLHLEENQFSGSIPTEIEKLTNLTLLNLGNNQLSDTIPSEIGQLTNLTDLLLYGNQLSGPIPSEIGNLVNLTNVNFSFNQLSDTIPASMGDLENIRIITLSYNQLSGQIPSAFGDLTNLTDLFLQNNHLDGPVPSELSGLTNLYNLFISSNQLSALPDLSGISSLTNVTISNNQFTFEDIEPNITIPYLNYAPQDSIGMRQDTTVAIGASLELSVNTGGTSNMYQWRKNGINIPGANNSTYTIPSADSADTGAYVCAVTNNIATALTLYTKTINIHVEGISGLPYHSSTIPMSYRLYQNFPNPFNNTTMIYYQLSNTAYVELSIYNLLGQKIATPISEKQEAGQHQIVWDASGFASGIYYYQLKSDKYRDIKKMLLAK